MALSENRGHTEFSHEILYQELADVYQVFLNLFPEGVPLLSQYLDDMSRLLKTSESPVQENPIIAMHAAHNYISKLRAPIPPCYYNQEPAARLVESVLRKLNYGDLVKKQAGYDSPNYANITVILIEKERHFLTKGVEIGIEQTCAVIDALRMSLNHPTSHSDV
jgi:hypothetical protein